MQNTEAVVGLIDEGNTIPFIARYRKEMTGSMDDQLLREMFDRLAYLRSLDQRRAEVKESIASQEKLTDELAKAIDDASTLAEVEDLYRPYKPKRRTRASIAREKGLEPLAEFLFAQDKNSIAPEIEAEKYTDAEKKVATADDALAGARDIIAENTSDDAEIRKKLRALLQSRGTLVSAGIKDEDSVYRIYYEFSEPVGKLQSHRILAINRGEREGFLKVSIELARPDAMKIIGEATLKPYTCATSEQVKTAIEDSYDRLIFPSIERDIRNLLTERADEQAIKTFALNLKPLLMQPPIKNMVTLGLDPAYRTGCKIAVVDGTGKVLDTGVVYPTPPHNKKEEAAAKLRAMIKKHGVKVISIGNGTASRESEQFVAELIHGTDLGYVIVNEAGASVYSASKLAANEFPEYDVSIR
ncbi:MAG: Tex-like N-terminal domain-containing protein, partial [Oscillospiraceae bacterium]